MARSATGRLCFGIVFMACFVDLSDQMTTHVITTEIDEDLKAGSTIYRMERKVGVKYSFHEDAFTDVASLFEISSEGVIKSKVIFDYEDERRNEFDLVIVARQVDENHHDGAASVVRVRIRDVNDNRPKFAKDLFVGTVIENSPPGTSVLGLEDVYAEDPDSGELSGRVFNIVAGNEAGKFEVDSHDLAGLKFLRIKTKGLIDREETAFFMLTIQISDGGNPTALSSTTHVRINVLDVNDNSPVFDPPIFSASVNENSDIGTSVLQVKTLDKDIHENSEVYYFFEPAHDFFTIDPHTGVVEVASVLNFERGNFFELQVIAKDRGRNSRQATTKVQLLLIDVSGFPPNQPPAIDAVQEPPVFDKDLYFVRIREDFAVGGLVLRVSAWPGARWQNTRAPSLQYTKATDNEEVFSINSKNGAVTLVKPLDFERRQSYTLKIKAQLQGSTVSTAVEVHIDVTDIEENIFTPVFREAALLKSIPDDADQNTVVTKVTVQDSGQGSSEKLKYSITGGNGFGWFQINEDGEIRPLVRLSPDLLSLPRLNLLIEVKTNTTIPRTARLYLQLQVNKARIRLVFPTARQSVDVRENNSPGTFVAVVRAVFYARVAANHAEKKPSLEYSFTDGENNGKPNFAIDSTTGIITAAVSLDREKRAFYVIDVLAKVKGGVSSESAVTQVVVNVADVNDNAPSFAEKEYQLDAAENQEKIPNLLCLAAYDPDESSNANITYSIASGNDAGLFSIDPLLGILCADRPLDYEDKPTHELVVMAADGGRLSGGVVTASVKINVRDENDAPMFLSSSHEVYIKEDEEVTKTLYTLSVTDEDRDENGKFTCAVSDMGVETMDMFVVGTTSQGCTLALRGYLEWSRRAKYQLTVRVTDNARVDERKSSTAKVTIHVVDTNNHAPKFVQASYWVSVAFDTRPGTPILQVEAQDLDSEENAGVRYATNSDTFEVQENDGVVNLRRHLTTDKKYIFTVTATDSKQKSSAVLISVTAHRSADRPPKFAQQRYYLKVAEGLDRLGDQLDLLRAQDQYGGEVNAQYSVIGGDPRRLFAVNRTSGALTLRSPLDYEKVKQHRLVVRASVRSWSSVKRFLVCETVVIVNVTDVNDNSPRFALLADPFVTSFNRLNPPGSKVAKTTADDADSGDHGAITYRLEGATAGLFQIDNKSGVITSKKSAPAFKAELYKFEVVATDSSPPYRTSRAAINVHVNKTSPPLVFSVNSRHKISETARVGTSLVKLDPKNRDGKPLKFSLATGNEDRALCIDTTGEIRVQKPLDREKTAAYHTMVQVHRGAQVFSGPLLTINVTDTNDHVPRFLQDNIKVFIRENLPPNQEISSALATDPDEGRLKYSIIYVEDPRSKEMFSFRKSGMLVSVARLDRELLDRHVLTVRAEGSGDASFSMLAQVVVIVVDENDNPPVFAAHPFEVWVPFGSEAGSPIFRLKAVDADRGRNGMIRFSAISGNDDHYISVNSASGDIFLQRRFVTLKPITVKVMARDLGRPSRNSSTDVIIIPLPVRGPPLFVSDPFIGHVTENQGTARVLQVAASSEDSVVYSIISGNELKHFELHPGTGVITTTTPLDREEHAQYTLVVRAKDTVNRLSEVKVKIHVDNVNDNGPRLIGAHNGVFEGEISRHATRNAEVMELEARDRDTPDTLFYHIQDEKAQRYFWIDASSGYLRTNELLTALMSPFEFSVVVEDNGVPPRKVAAQVRIILLQHQLSQQTQFSRRVKEDVTTGTNVMTVEMAQKIPNCKFSIASPLSTPFRINPVTGVVSVHRTLDYEQKRGHSLVVQAQNERNAQDYANLHIDVEVLDANDNAPVFMTNREDGDGSYIAFINRNAVDGTEVLNVTATDSDSGSNALLRYRLVSGDNGMFTVDQTSGMIKRRGGSAFRFTWYNLTVEAYDAGEPSLSGLVRVNVQVGEFPPEFTRMEYVFTVSENNKEGASMGRVHATSFSGAVLSYSIVQGKNRKFNLNSITGELQAAASLDYERDSNLFYMRIRATENHVKNPLSADVNIRLLVKDLNDNTPVFVKQRYVSTLPESTPIGTTVASVTAVDKDSGINGQFHYHVTSPLFKVNPYTGVVVTARPLDYEAAASHMVHIWAVDSGSPTLNGTARVLVQLRNVNDNPPVFTQSLYQVDVSEDAHPNELVATVQASDKDNDPVTYSIISGDQNSSFMIDDSSGVVRLVDDGRLVLTGPYYKLNVTATDGYHVTSAMLVVGIQDINNHKPEFTDCANYHPHVLEETAPGEFVVKVSAEDKDIGANGEVQYEIELPIKGQEQAFVIDPDTGVIKSAARFDREEKQLYQIIVKGKDGGQNMNEKLEGICLIEIQIDDVNDEAPKFDDLDYTVTIPENTEIGGSVLRVSATDPDAGNNGTVWYTLSSPNDYFAVDDFTGLVTTKRELELRTYTFEVLAWDKGKEPKQGRTQVSVEVFSQKDTPPIFTKSMYTAQVREDVSTAHEVICVNATSVGTDIYYSIETHPSPFSIDPVGGVVRTSMPLDYEKTPNYTLTIKAKTSYPYLVARATLNIFLEDVNDSPPAFSVSNYRGHVTENAPIGTYVLQVSAEDPDVGSNGRVSYVFRKKVHKNLFYLDSKSGIITTRQKFDREKRPSYTLIVKAQDDGEPSKFISTIVEVIIKDENDNAPVFTKPYYNVTVREDATPNARVVTVSAEDKDVELNARVSYYITSGNNGAVFGVNRDNIIVTRTLDRETREFYELGITASDGKNSNKAMVYVRVTDVNDNNPEFSTNTYEASVKENQPRGTRVMTFSATDKDMGLGGKFTFDISGQGLSAFQVDPDTGVLRTNRPLDREEKKRYEFLALAKDTLGRTGYADVVINIQDVNDNAPSFPDESYLGYVHEEQGSVNITRITAVDEDDPNEGGNSVVKYELLDDADGFFQINAKTGLIKSTGKRLDREEKDKYFVVVKATDCGTDTNGTALWGTVNVTIVVLDKNDHEPKFRKPLFTARVSENAKIGLSITTLQATDNDIGTNAKLHYRIVDSSSKRMFKLVEETGVLQVAKSLDYETTEGYLLSVTVTDSGHPFHSDKTEVRISVEDYNDNPPVFNPVAYTVQVEEDAPSGSSLLQVSATDWDSGPNKYFTFSIAGGDPSNRFFIDKHMGELFVDKPLDRETLAEYHLTVRATNTKTPHLHGDANVNIILIDKNDNGPVFDSSNLHTSVRENMPPPVAIVTLSVTDPDLEGANAGPFTFGLTSHKDLFTVDNKTGVLRTIAKLDREKQQRYKVAVWAKDNGGLKTDEFVYVVIKDVNDHQHYSGKMELTLNSYKGKFPGGDVGKVFVKDEDTDDERQYEMLSRSSEYFFVERNSGTVRCKPNPTLGIHKLTVNVSDVRSSYHPVISEVSILVKAISAEALNKSVAVRLTGLSREDIVTNFLPSFKETVSEVLETLEENVDLFNVQMAPGPHQAVDVRFAAHGSPYYAPERIITKLKNDRPKLNYIGRSYKVRYEAIGVDKCLSEPCEVGGCTSVLKADGSFEVIGSDDQTFLSLVVNEEARCAICGAGRGRSRSCRSNPCLNGGTCQLPAGHKCRCPSGFDGPRCELTTRSFMSGEWVWLQPLRQCSTGSLSLEFATMDAKGLLLYHGPTSPLEEGDVYDFVAVELFEGRVQVSMSLGNVSDDIHFSVSRGPALNDGEWHKVAVQMNGTTVTVTIDDCKLAEITEEDDSVRVENKSRCEAWGRFKSPTFKSLNVNGPVQLGGVQSRTLPHPQLLSKDFVGCIRHVTNNQMMYDLASPSNSKGSRRGCPLMEQHCKLQSCSAPSKCVPSWSGHACHCALGHTGAACEQATEPVSYNEESLTRYFFTNKFEYDPRETEIHLKLRTRDSDGGVLLFSEGSEQHEVSLLELVPHRSNNELHLLINYTFNLGDSLEVIQLTSVNVGDGQWHEVSVVRKRTQVTLTVDKEYSATAQSRGQHTLFTVDPIQTYIGGLPRNIGNSVASRVRRQADVAKDFIGCLNDVRYNGHSLHHKGSKEIARAQSLGVTKGCQSTTVCAPDPCPGTHWCHDVWRAHICLPRLCTSRPCLNGGSCYEGVNSAGLNRYRCVCPPKYQGIHCEIEAAIVASTPDPALESGLIIGICVLIVTLILSVCLTIMHIKYSRAKLPEAPVDERQFKRDNVVDYHIEGGGETDIDEDGLPFRDMFHVFGEAHTPEKKATRKINNLVTFQQPSRTSCDREKFADVAHCTCAEPASAEVIFSCADGRHAQSTNPTPVATQAILGIRRESPEGREDDNSNVTKGDVTHSYVVIESGRRPTKYRRARTCDCKASQSSPDTPSPVHFLPVDAIQHFALEGYGSPAVSLSTLGYSETDFEGREYPWQHESFEMKDKFDRLARIYDRVDSPDRLSWN